jgi:hypothetical protein
MGTVVQVVALGFRPSVALAPMASRPPLRMITPHRPALRAGAGSGLGAPLLPSARAAPAPAPRHSPCPGMIRVSRSGPAKGRCTSPSLSPTMWPSPPGPTGRQSAAHRQQHAIRANPQRRFDPKAGAPRLRLAGLHRPRVGGRTEAEVRTMPPAGDRPAPGWRGRRCRVRAHRGGCSALPSRTPPTQAEPSRRGPWRPGRSYSGALHLDARNHACSTVCGSTAYGMGAGVSGECRRVGHGPAHGRSRRRS